MVSREQDPDALHVIEARCEEMGATLLLEYRDFEVEDRLQATGAQALQIRGSRATYDELFLPMFGEHAAQNAAAAIVALEALIDKALDPGVAREALSLVRWPGRMEIVRRHPTILLDGAHNPAGAEALTVALREAFIWERLHVVTSISANKDIPGIVRPLAALADIAYVATNTNERSADPLLIAEEFAVLDEPVLLFDSVAEALEAALAVADETDLIVVTGSLYTVADAHRALGEPF